MKNSRSSKEIKNPIFVIEAYRQGYFPMAVSRHGKIEWHSPDPRAIIPIENTKMPRSLKKFLRKNIFEYTINQAFDEVIENCAKRRRTWINDDILKTYKQMNRLGFASSVETWYKGELAGGLYGVNIGGAFFGESMFNNQDNAAKAAFYHLISVMNKNGYVLLDSQYINDFTAQLGAIEIPKRIYLILLQNAISLHRELY
jgi:leucyl/phenylalanyl-tRNA--protein transferase